VLLTTIIINLEAFTKPLIMNQWVKNTTIPQPKST